MSISSRLLRLLRAEINHRLSNKPEYKPYNSADRATGVGGDAWEDGGPETSSRTSSRASNVDLKLAAHYRALELPYGADLGSVRAAYKRLMKLYHPDRYQDPASRETATEVVKRINAAYGDLVRHLEGQETGE